MRRSLQAARFTSTRSVVPLLAAAVALGAAWQMRGHERVRDLTWETRSLGAIRFPTPTVRVFRSSRELQRYVTRADPGAHVPELDLTGLAGLVLVTAGPRSSDGYAVQVRRIVEERSRIVVQASERAPSVGDDAVPGVTYPYRLLALRRLGKQVVVKWQGR
jgi:hypothetical protein